MARLFIEQPRALPGSANYVSSQMLMGVLANVDNPSINANGHQFKKNIFNKNLKSQKSKNLCIEERVVRLIGNQIQPHFDHFQS